MSAMATRIRWTRFTDKSAAHKREMDQDWAELGDHIRNAGPYAAKAMCPWIKLAEFGDQKTVRGSLRNGKNMLAIVGVEGDYDGEVMQPAIAISLLERAGIKALVYTSPSHRPEAPRWRVLAPLSRPHGPEARTALLARVNGALSGVLSGESFTLSQSYYYGRVQGQTEYLVEHTYGDPEEGQFVDEMDELDDIAISKAAPQDDAEPAIGNDIATRVELLGRRLRTRDGRRDLLKTYLGDLSRRGLSADEISLLAQDVCARFFDSEDPVDWANVNEMIVHFTSNDAHDLAAANAVVGDFVSGLKQKPATPLLLNLAELQAASASISWLVKGVIPADSLGVLFGGSGTFKSFIALDAALHVAHGLKWLGKKTRKGPIIFVAAEGGAGLWRRIEAWHKQRGLDWRGIEFYVVPVAVAILTDAKAVVAAAEAVVVRPAMVIIDTLAQTFEGEENSASDMSAYLRALNVSFRALWQCVVLVIHHSGHQATERPRGSSAIRGNVDFMLGVFREEIQMLATLECHKQKDGELFEAATFDLTVQTLALDADGDPVTSLVAAHINNAAALVEAKVREATSARGGKIKVFLDLLQNGMTEKELRNEFYKLVEGDLEAKKKAFQRARGAAIEAKFIEIATAQGSTERRIIVLNLPKVGAQTPPKELT